MSEIIEKIKEHVSIYDLFDLQTPKIAYDTQEKPCQINCPFHGADLGPSARVFPATNSMYCWACDRSWDVLDFWTEINGWEKDDGTLDIGKGIQDLSKRFKIESIRADWKKGLLDSLSSISTKKDGYAGLDMKSREEAKDTYCWMVSKNIAKIKLEDREAAWDEVKDVWDSLDSVDLSQDSWKKTLHTWMKEHRMLHVSNSV